ncbi:16S rRNA (guanine(966)-N(2))-methyltransferase RsmD [Nesterenkonia salmonea]|uniref:16S rRNA (Guanine(966)-N(2))-methyltransferase RsmD n=1 Tax=Nesterenkonia salmonea TaxID=1804987 RepID=A0A5R9BDU8_9MICC|nr:16S rRNA (guanine(966)-N(2))-methyltransferase RsmD [Nesterenkonia salmonea]TLP98815.1 16S rRNA (guanine(966)-N(2))-methyltransferase RsmD [Nesterenkonia salmonea]
MARIIAGTHKGRRISVVPGTGTRPTSDRVKESLFSRLEGYDALEDAVVVDVFAGSGALGFEAISRGSRSLEVVDVAESAYRTLTKNAALFTPAHPEGTQPTEVIRVHKAQALRYLKSRHGDPIELLFLDPPYSLGEAELAKVLEAAAPQLHPAATVVVERDAQSPEPSWPAALRRFHEKSYGSTRIWLAEPQ